ncbi:hypothetical protein D5018_04010 [Parashewanella curva]|uniref:Uncharacterized protein n=1 Tax=Parashewanella curva TaxID=2338552 RepID=A0A3L8Q053_9GAMM|nr:hypothetical protein [Parashewanella curva]RLV61014.1 hypothetical protein D5018_04010 [Parashewanella curva]
MSITGITATDDNGVKRITNAQLSANATIDGETVILDGPSSQLKATGLPGITIKNSQIKIDADTPNNADDASCFTYGARQNDNSRLRVIDNSTVLIAPLSIRKNMHISEVSNSSVIESGGTKNMFCYSQRNCIIQNAVFRGINVWEIFGAPSIAAGITIDGANFGYLNWETPRLDFLGFAVKNIQTAHAWVGSGNGGNNHVWHWNNDPSFDNTKLRLQAQNNRYYEGISIAYQFMDRDSGNPVENVTVIYRDNFQSNTSVRGRYKTDNQGKLTGTFDSKNRSNGSNESRPALFMLDKFSDTNGNDHQSPGGGSSYSIRDVENKLEVRSYLHEAPAGFGETDVFNLSSPIGALNPDYSVAQFSRFVMVPDAMITESDQAAVAAYTTIENSAKFYDRVKKNWADNDSQPTVAKQDSTIDAGSLNIVINATASNAFAISGNTITIKASIFTGSIKTTGTVTLQNGATVSGTIQDSNGDSSISVTVPAGFDTISVHATQADADNGTNTLASGLSFRYQSSSRGDTDIWYRLIKNDGSEIVSKYRLPSGAGIYTTNLVVTAENAALGQIVNDMAQLKADLAVAKLQSTIAATNTQPV